MRHHLTYALLSSLLLLCSMGSRAQPDPVLASTIVDKTKIMAAEYGSQNALLFTIGLEHAALHRDQKKIYELNKKFNDYLNMFNDVLVYAAQGYGFLTDIKILSDNISELSSVLASCPANAFAVALSEHKNRIYLRVCERALGIVQTIRLVCLKPKPKKGADGKETNTSGKMTEQDRIDLLLTIRPQLQTLARELKVLSIYTKFTTPDDVWLEVMGRARHYERSKSKIARQALARWQGKYKTVKVK